MGGWWVGGVEDERGVGGKRQQLSLEVPYDLLARGGTCQSGVILPSPS